MRMHDAKLRKHRENFKGDAELPVRVLLESASKRRKPMTRGKRKRVEIPEQEAKLAAMRGESKNLGESECNVEVGSGSKDFAVWNSGPRSPYLQYGTSKVALKSGVDDPLYFKTEGCCKGEKVRSRSPGGLEPEKGKQDRSKSRAASGEPNRKRERRNLLADLGTVNAGIASLTGPWTRGMAQPLGDSKAPHFRDRQQRVPKIFRNVCSETTSSADIRSIGITLECAQGYSGKSKDTRGSRKIPPVQPVVVDGENVRISESEGLKPMDIPVHCLVEGSVVGVSCGRITRSMRNKSLTCSPGDTRTPQSGANRKVEDRIDKGTGHGELSPAVAPSASLRASNWNELEDARPKLGSNREVGEEGLGQKGPTSAVFATMKLRNRKALEEVNTALERPRKRARTKQDQFSTSSKEQGMAEWLDKVEGAEGSTSVAIREGCFQTDGVDLPSEYGKVGLRGQQDHAGGHECVCTPNTEKEVTGRKNRYDERGSTFRPNGDSEKKHRIAGHSKRSSARRNLNCAELRKCFKDQLESESRRADLHNEGAELGQNFVGDDKAEATSSPLSLSRSFADIQEHVVEQRIGGLWMAGEDFVAAGTAAVVAYLQVAGTKEVEMKGTVESKDRDGDSQFRVGHHDQLLDELQIKKRHKKGLNVGRQALSKNPSDVVKESLQEGRQEPGSTHKPRLRSDGMDIDMQKALTASGNFWKFPRMEGTEEQGPDAVASSDMVENPNVESLEVNARNLGRVFESVAKKNRRRKTEMPVKAKRNVDELQSHRSLDNVSEESGHVRGNGSWEGPTVDVYEGPKLFSKRLPLLQHQMADESRRVRFTSAVPGAEILVDVSEGPPSVNMYASAAEKRFTGDIRRPEGSMSQSVKVVEIMPFARECSDNKSSYGERMVPVNILEPEPLSGEEAKAGDRQATENGEECLFIKRTTVPEHPVGNENLLNGFATDSTIDLAVKKPNTAIQCAQRGEACMATETPSENEALCRERPGGYGRSYSATLMAISKTAKSRKEGEEVMKSYVAGPRSKMKQDGGTHFSLRASCIDETERRPPQGNVRGQEDQRKSGAERLQSNLVEKLDGSAVLFNHPNSAKGPFDLEEQFGVGSPEMDIHVGQSEDNDSLGAEEEIFAINSGLLRKDLVEPQTETADETAMSLERSRTRREQSATGASLRDKVDRGLNPDGKKFPKQLVEKPVSDYPRNAPIFPFCGDLSSSRMVSCTELLQSLHSGDNTFSASSGRTAYERGLGKYSIMLPFGRKSDSQSQGRESASLDLLPLLNGLSRPSTHGPGGRHDSMAGAETSLAQDGEDFRQNVTRTEARSLHTGSLASDEFPEEQSVTAIIEGSLEDARSLSKPGIGLAPAFETNLDSTPQERLVLEPSSAACGRYEEFDEDPSKLKYLTGSEPCRAFTVARQACGGEEWSDACLSFKKSATSFEGLNAESLERVRSDALKGKMGLHEMEAASNIVPTGSNEYFRVERDNDDGLELNGVEQAQPCSSNSDGSAEILRDSFMENDSVEFDEPFLKLHCMDATKRTEEHSDLDKVCIDVMEVHTEAENLPSEAEKNLFAEDGRPVVVKISTQKTKVRVETVEVHGKRGHALANADNHCEMDDCCAAILERGEVGRTQLAAFNVQTEVDELRSETDIFACKRGGFLLVGEAQTGNHVEARQLHGKPSMYGVNVHTEAKNNSEITSNKGLHCGVEEAHIEGPQELDRVDESYGIQYSVSGKNVPRSRLETMHLGALQVDGKADIDRPETGYHSESKDGRTAVEKTSLEYKGLMEYRNLKANIAEVHDVADRYSEGNYVVEEAKCYAEVEAYKVHGKADIEHMDEDEHSKPEGGCVRAESLHFETVDIRSKIRNGHIQQEDENTVPEDSCIRADANAGPAVVAETEHSGVKNLPSELYEEDKVKAHDISAGMAVAPAQVEEMQLMKTKIFDNATVVHVEAEEVDAAAGEGHSKILAERIVLKEVYCGPEVLHADAGRLVLILHTDLEGSEGETDGTLADAATGSFDGEAHSKEQKLQSGGLKMQGTQNVNSLVEKPQADARESGTAFAQIHTGVKVVDWDDPGAGTSGTSIHESYEQGFVGQSSCPKTFLRESCPSLLHMDTHSSAGGWPALSSQNEENPEMRMGQLKRTTIAKNVAEDIIVDGTKHLQLTMQVMDGQSFEHDPVERARMSSAMGKCAWESFMVKDDGPYDMPEELDGQKEEGQESGPGRLEDTGFQVCMADKMEELVVSKRKTEVCSEAVQEPDRQLRTSLWDELEEDREERSCLRVYSKKKRVAVTPTPVEHAGMRIRPRPLDPYQSIPIFWEGRDKEFYEFDGGSFHRWVQQQDESRLKQLAFGSGDVSSDAGRSRLTVRTGRHPIFIPPFRKLPVDEHKEVRSDKRQHLERGVQFSLACPEAYVRYTKLATGTLGHVLGGSFSSIPSVYDMDNDDEKWLQAFNENHKKSGSNKILFEDTFEQLIELFEREFYRMYQRHTAFSATAREKGVTKEDLAKKCDAVSSQRSTADASQPKVAKGRGISHRRSPLIKSERTFVIQTISEDCCICNGGENSTFNTVYRCHICLVNVHHSCYGIWEEGEGSDCQATSANWCCRKCEAVIGGVALPSISCAICCKSGGAMKATVDPSKWAHVACALYTNETFFVDPEAMEPIDGLLAVEMRVRKQRERCGLCGAREGSCVRCSTKGCRAPFHISCGVRHGASFELRHTKNLVVGVRSFCPRHAAAMSAPSAEDSEYDPSSRDSDATEVLPAVSTESSDTQEIGHVKQGQTAERELAGPVKPTSGTKGITTVFGGDTSSLANRKTFRADLSEIDAQESSALVLRSGSTSKLTSHWRPQTLGGMDPSLALSEMGKLEFGDVCATPSASSVYLSPDLDVVDQIGKMSANGSDPIDGKSSGHDLDICFPSSGFTGAETEPLKADSLCQSLPRIKTLHTTLAPLQVVKAVYTFWQNKRLRSKGSILHELKQLEGARVQGIFNRVVQLSDGVAPIEVHAPQGHILATRRPRNQSRDPISLKILELRQQMEMLRKIAGNVVRREQLKREDQKLLYKSVQQRLLLAGQRARIRHCHWCENTQTLLSCSSCIKAFCFHCFKHRRGYGVKGWIAASRLPKYVCNFCMGCTSRDSWPSMGANLTPSTLYEESGNCPFRGAGAFPSLDNWNDKFVFMVQPNSGAKVVSLNEAIGNLDSLGTSYGKVPFSQKSPPLLPQGRGKLMCAGMTADGQAVHTKFALPSLFKKSRAAERLNESRVDSSVLDTSNGKEGNSGCKDDKKSKRRVKTSEMRGGAGTKHSVRTTKRVKKPVKSSNFVYGSEEETTTRVGSGASVEDAKVIKLSELRDQGATTHCQDIPEACAGRDPSEGIHPLKFGIKYSPTIGKLILRRYGGRQQQQ